MSCLADQSSSPVAEELKWCVQCGGGGSAGVHGHGHAFALCLLLGDGAGDEADPAAGEKCWKSIVRNSSSKWFSA